MKKVLYNDCYGGFSVSPLVIKRYFEIKHPDKTLYVYRFIDVPVYGDSLEEYKKYMHKSFGGYMKKISLDEINKYPKRSYYIYDKDLGDVFFYPFVSCKYSDKIEEKTAYKKFVELTKDAKIISKFMFNEMRDDETLIKIVEELGTEKASGDCAELAIEEIYGDTYTIHEFDGLETVY